MEKMLMTLSLGILLLVIVSGCIPVNNSNNSQLANPAATYCIDSQNKYEIRTNTDGSQYGVCILENGLICDEWEYYRGECNIDSIQKICVKNNGRWLNEYKECEGISETICNNLGGQFDSCASACRHSDEAQVCTMQCVMVCEFE